MLSLVHPWLGLWAYRNEEWSWMWSLNSPSLALVGKAPCNGSDRKVKVRVMRELK